MAIVTRASAEILFELHKNAKGHAEASDGFFTIDPFNSHRIESHLTLHTIGDTANRRFTSPHRANADLLDATAKLVDSRYESLPDPATEEGRNGIALHNMAEQVKARENIALGFRHGETRDIAFNLGYISIGLSKRGASHRTALMLSKGIDFLRIDTRSFGYTDSAVDDFLRTLRLPMRKDRTVSVRDFVGVVADYTYFVIPSSSSFEEIRKKHGSTISRFNGSTLKLLNDDFEETVKDEDATPLVYGSGITGTLEKSLDIPRFQEDSSIEGSFDTYPAINIDTHLDSVRVVGEISPYAVKSIEGIVTYTSGIKLSRDQSKIDINPHFIYPDEKTGGENISRLLLGNLAELEPELQFIIDLRGNLPVVK